MILETECSRQDVRKNGLIPHDVGGAQSTVKCRHFQEFAQICPKLVLSSGVIIIESNLHVVGFDVIEMESQLSN